MSDQKAPTGMVIDGVAASEALDSSGEILKIDGCDISTLAVDGVLNYEHRGDDAPGAQPGDNLGKIIFAKKIFKDADCDTDRQRKYWKSLELPFIYFMCRLYDGAGHHGAKELAAQIRDAVANGEPPIMRFSIEGSTLATDSKNKKILTRSIARVVAITRKPCNRSAVSGIVADPNAPDGWSKSPEKVTEENRDILEEALKRSEHPGFRRLGAPISLRWNPEVDGENFKKTLTAGSYEAAPSSLSGGAALQREDLGVRQKIKGAFRSWKKTGGDLRTYLKTQVPEASDEYVERFSKLVDEVQVKQKALDIRKTEINLQRLAIELRKASDDILPVSAAKKTVVDWQGQKVRPGLGDAVIQQDGETRSVPIDILSGDEDHLYGLPRGMLDKDWSSKDLRKFPRHAVSVMYPPSLVKASLVVDANVHGHSLSAGSEQKKLIHGLDLTDAKVTRGTHTLNDGRSMWARNGDRHVFVKPELYRGRGTTNDARREVTFYNAARDVFGLAAHLPVTAAFRHPKTGEEMVAVEGLDAYHPERQGRMSAGVPTGGMSHSPEDLRILKSAYEDGSLPRLAIMDHVLGQVDRMPDNWMIGRDGKVKLIDHGLTFEDGGSYPDFLDAWGADKASWLEEPIPMDVGVWAQKLDPRKLEKTLGGLHPQDAQRTISRLQQVQQHFLQNPTPTWRSLLFSEEM